MSFPSLVLASASPARYKLLKTAGIEVTICKSNFDESQVKLDNPLELVQTLALYKAQTVANQFTDVLILGCDSVLAIDDEIYGKPESSQEAIARWQKMRGHHGILYTGHALIDQKQEKQIIHCGITKVYFAAISDRTIEEYVASGEPLKCAGSFAIEGRGGAFIDRIEGCHSNVIGLSLPLFRQMLTELNYKITDFWKID